jgi:peptidoglycan L-alanyl-D-glutamate endopeptidase CwlK
MRDKISEARVRLLHPDIRDEVKMLIEKAEEKLPSWIGIRVVQGLRTWQEQAALYAIGRTVKGKNPRPKKPMGDIVTKAKAGYSFHNFGLAIDFGLLVDKNRDGRWDEVSWNTKADRDLDGIPDWNEVVVVIEEAGYEWGGKWATIVDAPHLEKSFGKRVADLRALYFSSKFIPGTMYVALN